MDFQKDEFDSIEKASGHAQEKPRDSQEWFRRIDLSGFLNAGFVKTGTSNTQSKGHFYAAERRYGSCLLVDAAVWKQVSAFIQLSLIGTTVATTQMYAQINNLLGSVREDLLSVKIGRVDLPFGEEYLFQQANKNPMILKSVAWPWGYDEGVLLFGSLGPAGWLFSVTDGSVSTAADTHGDKAFHLKLHTKLLKTLYLSGSVMSTGQTPAAGMWMDEVILGPVGATASPGGASPSATVGIKAYEAAFIWDVLTTVQLMGNFGQVFIQDASNLHDRTLTYFMGQLKAYVMDHVYVAGRASGVGTFDPNKGYRLGGDYNGVHLLKIGAANAFDVKSILRYAVALGIELNPQTVLKIEGALDDLSLVSGSTLTAFNDRFTAAAEVVVSF